MAREITIPCRGLVKGKAEGRALVAPTTLSFWGEVDPVTVKIAAAGGTDAYFDAIGLPADERAAASDVFER